MKKSSRSSPCLDGASRNVLADIVKQGSASAGVNATVYRAQHRKQLDLLEQLERIGFLRKDQDRYWVTLHGLILLNDKKSKFLLGACEHLFAVLQHHYETTPKTRILVAELAGLANLPSEQVTECLGYIYEFHFWATRSNSFDNPAVSFVEPAETILRCNSFKELIDERSLLRQKQDTSSRNYKFSSSPLHTERQEDSLQAASLVGSFNANDAWKAIKSAYDTDKKAFGRKFGLFRTHSKGKLSSVTLRKHFSWQKPDSLSLQ